MERDDARAGAAARLLKRVADVEPHETVAVITSFLLFFCVLGGYFAVRPVRETVGTILGRERVADLFGIVWIVSLAIIPAYGWLCSRYRRSVFLPWIYGFVAVSLIGVGMLLREADDLIFVGQFFFVFISVVNLFVVSVFWSFLLEMFNPGQTKRLFGFIAAGGTAGALTGPLLTDVFVGMIGNSGVLFMGAGLFTIAIAMQRILLRVSAHSDWTRNELAPRNDRPMGGNPFAGVTLILKSPYLLGITTFVILLATVNTFLYFEQLRVVGDTFADVTERTRVFSRIDYTVQTLTILSQFIITGRLAKKWGVVVLLTAVPIAMVGGFLLLAATGTFAVLVGAMITRRVGEYAFVRPGREMLFGPVDLETKYKAKNTIDVPVYRGGDALTAQISNVLSARGSSSTVALIAAGVAAVWAVNGYLIGKARDRRGDTAAPARTTVQEE
ncbi:MAG TPA: MFS transporter [Longimicrobiales bacterium]|nr:MFS transporter [Longimicrobiales bacterium]